MKNTLKINIKKVLPVISGLLFVALTIKSVQESSPLEVLNHDFSRDITVQAANVIDIEQTNIEDISIDEVKKEESSTASITIASTEDRVKVEKIRRYLSGRNAPLADYAEEFVKAANYYGIDYRLVASISIIESSGGIHCFRTYNAWGWGKLNFDSWTDGIWTVSKGLSKYYASGLDTPKEISYRYCPPNAVNWANKVSYVMNVIESM